MTVLETALDLLERGLWPVPVTPIDDPHSVAPGKAPIGVGWGLKLHTPESLRKAFTLHPNANLGIKLGPQTGVVDVDVDDREKGDPVVLRMFGGEVPETLGWSSAKGNHYAFQWDDRLEKYGKAIVRNHPNYPGVELRFGWSADGRQYQSVVPPSVGNDGKPREWNGCETIAPLPESVFADLDAYLVEKKPEPEPGPSRPRLVVPGDNGDSAAEAYFANALRNNADRVAAAPEGERHSALLTAAIALGGHLHHGILSEADVAMELAGAAKRAGLSGQEISTTVRDGLRYGKDKPLPWPEKLTKLPESPKPKAIGPNGPIGPRERIWEPPVVDEPPPIEPFPLDVFPVGLRELCEAGSRVMHIPVDYFAAAALALAGGVIGRTVCLKARKNYDVIPNLFLAVVGPPGSKKSPALKMMAHPLFEIDHDLRDQYKEEKKRFKELGDKEALPPEMRHLTMDDSTRESFAKILSENPRGLVLVKDELMAWVKDLDAYRSGKGSDQQFWMSLNSGALVKVTRKGAPEPLVIPHPCGAVVGCLTPSSLPGVRGDHGDNGWLDRLLFAFPQTLKGDDEWDTSEVPEDLIRDWRDAVGRLWSRPMVPADEAGRERPYFITFTPRGKDAWVNFYRGHQAEKNGPDFPESLRGPWSKYEGFTLRLALILSQLHQAYDPAARGAPADVDSPEIYGAAKLIAYFKAHFRRVRTALTGARDSITADAVAVLAWLTSEKVETFTKRDVLKKFRKFSDQDRSEALSSLTACGYIAYDGKAREGDQPGRSREVYAVNPFIYLPRAEWANRANSPMTVPVRDNTTEANRANRANSPTTGAALRYLAAFLSQGSAPRSEAVSKAADFDIPESDIEAAADALGVERDATDGVEKWSMA